MRHHFLVHSLSHVVSVVVHSQDSSVNGKQRPVEAQSHRAVEILPLLFGHLKNDFCWVLNASALTRTHMQTVRHDKVHIRHPDRISK